MADLCSLWGLWVCEAAAAAARILAQLSKRPDCAVGLEVHELLFVRMWQSTTV